MADNSKTWFLSDEDLKKYGRAASLDVKTSTAENVVTALIDAAAYLKEIDDLLASCASSGTKGDYVFIAAATISHDAVLSGVAGSPTLGARLGEASSKGVEVRILMAPPIDNKNNPKTFATDGVPNAFHDTRRPAGSRQNQRFVVIHHQGKLVAFVGIDLFTAESFDGPEHDNTLPRTATRFLGGFHSVGVKLEGPAARDIDAVFRARWRDPEPINGLSIDRFLNAAIDKTIAKPAESTYAGTGAHAVQVLLTLVRNKVTKSSAVKEVTGYGAWKQAIAAAESFIYLEDPYFSALPIAELLASSLEKKPDLRVILVVPKTPDRNEASFAYWKSTMLAVLSPSGAEWAKRFAVYHLEETKSTKRNAIHCDSRVLIVDDVFVGIGSMSLSRRGLTLDTELSVGVYHEPDDDTPSFAQSLRLSLWREHLGLLGAAFDEAAKELIDIEKGFEAWATAAGKDQARATLHEPKGSLYDKGDYDKTPASYDRIDPSCEGTFRIRTPEARPSNEALVDMNQRVAKKYLEAADLGVFQFNADGKENIEAHMKELAESGSFLFPDEPPHKERKIALPYLISVRVCMTVEMLTMMEALIDAAIKIHDKLTTKKPVFGLLSFARNPRYVPYGAERGNHGLLLKAGSKMPKDKQGRTIEAVGRALDISIWNGHRILLKGYTGLDDTYKTQKKNAIDAVVSILSVLPLKAANGKMMDYDMGLPSVKEPEANLKDKDGNLLDSTVFIPRAPVKIHAEPGESRAAAKTSVLKLLGSATNTVKLPYEITGDIGWVYEDARKAMLAAIEANKGLAARIRTIFLDDNNHFHINVRIADEPYSKGKRNPAWVKWRAEGADLEAGKGGS